MLSKQKPILFLNTTLTLKNQNKKKRPQCITDFRGERGGCGVSKICKCRELQFQIFQKGGGVKPDLKFIFSYWRNIPNTNSELYKL